MLETATCWFDKYNPDQCLPILGDDSTLEHISPIFPESPGWLAQASAGSVAVDVGCAMQHRHAINAKRMELPVPATAANQSPSYQLA